MWWEHVNTHTHSQTQPSISHQDLQSALIPSDFSGQGGIVSVEKEGSPWERKRGKSWSGGRGWEKTSWRVSASSQCWSDNETLIRASQMAWWNTWTLSVCLSYCLFCLSVTSSFSFFPALIFHIFILSPFLTLCSNKSVLIPVFQWTVKW